LGASNLWFNSWTPTTAGSTFGACLGLFFLAILSRFLSAVKTCAEIAWAQSLRSDHRTLSSTPPTPPSDDTKAAPSDSPQLSSILPALPSASAPPSASSRSPLPFTPPFYLSIDLPRSILFGLQSFVAYLLMLAIMSYSVWFFVSILLGLMVGEMAFGRFIVLLGGGALGGHHGAEHL
ncbi:hypothetical protein JCM3765_000116, partial [Sporobolomyces pararoseus]